MCKTVGLNYITAHDMGPICTIVVVVVVLVVDALLFKIWCSGYHRGMIDVRSRQDRIKQMSSLIGGGGGKEESLCLVLTNAFTTSRSPFVNCVAKQNYNG